MKVKVMVIEYYGTTNKDYVMLAKVKNFSKQLEDEEKDTFSLTFKFDDGEERTYGNIVKFTTEEW